MSERKVLNKYYPPDFDPSKIPRMKLPKNRQYTVRLMAPFNMRCETCGEYIYKGKKFNARKEDVENQDYLGIRIYRFYIKCTRCLQEISFKTDPRNTDYEIEAGATRNFMALKLAEEQAVREEEEAKAEEANNPMILLENRTKQSKNEIELIESLEELKDLNRRHLTIDYETMLETYDPSISEKEREEKLQELDEQYVKTIKFQSNQKRKLIVEEEIIEDAEDEVPEKSAKIEPQPSTSGATFKFEKFANQKQKSVGGGLTASKKSLLGMVKKKENPAAKPKVEETVVKEAIVEETKDSGAKKSESKTSALALLGAYSDSENSE